MDDAGAVPLPAVLAALPSPTDNAISIGPLELRAYGLFIAVGAIVAVWIARRRWEATGGDTDAVATWRCGPSPPASSAPGSTT